MGESVRVGRRLLIGIALAVGPSVIATSGCVSDDNAGPASGADAAIPQADGTVLPHPEAGADSSTPHPDGSDATTPPADSGPLPDAFDAGPTGKLRVAWFADPAYVLAEAPRHGAAAPTYDACIAPHGTGLWQGPVLAKVGSNGLSLYDVSSYFDVPVGQYDVRVVSGGATSCDVVDGGPFTTTDFTSLPAVQPNAKLTVVATSDPNATSPGSLQVVALADDTTVTSGKVKVRFANFTDVGGFDYGLGGGDVFTPLFSAVDNVGHIAVADADAGTNVGVDTNGYVEVAPFSQIDSSIRQAGFEYAATPSLATAGGDMLSAFAVLFAGARGLLVCHDGQPSAGSPFLTQCTPVATVDFNAPTGTVRFGHFLADDTAGNIDFCVKYHSTPGYGAAPIGTVGPGPGTPYGMVSERYAVHAGFVYDVRVVAGGATDCATAIAPDTAYTAPTDPAGLVTVAFTGYVTAPDAGVTTTDAGADGGGLASNAFAALRIDDAKCVGSETLPAVRVVNVAAATPGPQNVDVFGNSTFSIDAVPYGGSSSTAALDACGYLGITATTNGYMQTTNGGWNYTNTGELDTLYLFSNGTQVKVLQCNDQDPSVTACTVLPIGG